MRYVVLIYDDERVWAGLDEAGRARYDVGHRAFSDAAQAAGVRIEVGEALAGVASARTARRVGDDVAVTDGPFAETTEQLGGLYLVDTPDEQTLLNLLHHLPEATHEIRECVEP
ncbi:YciI family protein [Cellulomonas sp. S1-8]|uniref:YciI family protein n=1 Tax=Cellulomonas sp. S1-8 TaxID=2904790 RepID=UPI0022430192|nr:YciI family protein [Cellulomonas sp. S1-8]UZN03613.1 YciI family protein [Cellulomonas sp. S1-8]